MGTVQKIKLYKPYPKQMGVHKACNDLTTFFITANCGRQSGKSALAIQQALYWAIDKRNVEVYWVSPTAGQATKVYKQMIKLIATAPFLKSHKGSQGDTEVVLLNGSVIKFRSSAQEDSLRGETIDYMIIDEGAFIKQSVYEEILLPMLNVKGKKVLVCSTPKGKNWFYYQYNRGLTGNPEYKSFHFTSSDNPHSNPKVIAAAKESLPKALFAQEYLAEFVDSAAIIENIQELAILNPITKPVEGDRYYMGIDVALKNDYNVVSIFNQNDELVAIDRTNNISAPKLKERLIKLFDLWKPQQIYIEENNQGLPIIQDLQDIHNIQNIQGFSTTSKSKPEIINQLINAFASLKITIINDEIVKSELEMFTMSISPTGHVRYSAPSGFNDDIVMSMAIGWECLQKNKATIYNPLDVIKIVRR